MILSCNKEKDNSFEKDKYEIISLLIQKLPPGPPPPPPYGVHKKDTLAFNKYVDSIYKLDVNIAILAHCAPINKFPKSVKENISNDFILLLEKLESTNSNCEKINLDLLKIPNNRKLKLVNKPFKNLFSKLDVSYYVAFSDVAINEVKDIAVVYMSEDTSSLSGSIDVYFLKKIDEKWKVFKRKTLSIS
ncbi:hypothetical protein [Aquimarina sediminis]|uniref:hypothetical protein n=1 Tax=Aquimarina sediminis TaxID=2070536 RepID=UPI000CA00B59|nr:hypothetical protein [Aquimarina sediminis]